MQYRAVKRIADGKSPIEQPTSWTRPLPAA
jgi:hypothetical protein